MLATSLSAPPVIAFGALLCKETWLLQWHLTAQFVSRLHPHHRQARKSLVAGRASLRLTTAAVCGAIDCALRLQTLFDGYVPALSRHLHKLRCLALSLRCQPATSACISGSSTAVRRAPFSFHPWAILTATFSHPQRLCRQPPKPPARLLSFSVCDAMPAPGPDVRRADAQTPHRQRWRPLLSLRAACGTRHGGVG